MFLKSLFVSNFRNYSPTKITFKKGINIIVGDNAQGKTNLLESIYVLALARSHRSFIDDNLIKINESQAKIRGKIKKEGISTEFEIIIKPKGKQLRIDNHDIKKVTDYISNMNVIIFYPEDLELIKGSPNERRKYINLELGQLNSGYLDVLNEYNKLLKLRNDFLKRQNNKEEIDQSYFDVITEYMIDKAVTIYRMRKKYIDKLNEYCGEIFKNISGVDGFAIRYLSGIDDYDKTKLKETLKTRLTQNRKTEIRVGATLSGPHRDDFEFIVDNINLKNFGSQGQQRAAILSVKLSEIEIFKSHKETTPILLLDDVFSELDDSKKNNLLKYIKKDIQTIITTTDINSIDASILKKARILKITSGKIKNEKVK